MHSSRWQAIRSVAAKIGCSPDSLKDWIRRLEEEQGQRDGTTSSDRERLKALEKENKELRRGIESVEFATLEWVDWFNNRRLMESIGNVPPTELETEYYEQTIGPAIAA